MIPPVAIAVISAAILAYEVLLVRLFAIVQWHHFAFMAISVALLGFGVSGTLIVLLRDPAERIPRTLFTASATVFALAAPGAFLLAQQVPFNALEVVWAPAGLLFLALIYALLLVPFTAGASCVGLAFRAPGARAGRVYLWNLLGSGAGALGIVGALFVLPPVACLGLVGALGFTAALLAAPRRLAVLPALLAALAAGGWANAPAHWTELRLSEFKGLTQALAVRDARLVETRSGPLALLSLVESPSVPFRHAPGLSLTAPALPPAQLGVFANGSFAEAIDLWGGDVAALAYLDHVPEALAYRLTRRPEVLVLEAGGGQAVLQAIMQRAGRIDAVDGNPQMLELMAEAFAATPPPLGSAEPQVTLADPRRFLTAARREWNLIRLPPVAAAPARGLNEDFLFTAEGLSSAHARLRPGGWLSATAETDLPPRIAFKLIATLDAALRAEGVADPARHILAIRSLTSLSIFAKRGAVGPADIAAAKAFAETRGFDLVHYPGMARTEANLRIRLAEPVFHDGFRALLGPARDSFVARYKFDIGAATDARPYFHDVFRWRALPELVALGPTGGAALIELGEPIVTATLVQALVLGAALVLLPLRGRLAGRVSRASAWRFGLYFTALGLAFLFIEIAWIQRFVLFLGHPLYAVSVVLTGFLVFAGLGAAASAPLEHRLAGRLSPLIVACGAIVALTLIYLALLPEIFAALAGLPAALRVLAALGLIAPLAFFMGMPFPLGLERIGRADADFVPWAWGLNGSASVVSAAAATLISMNFGIPTTLLIGAALYGAAAFLLPGPHAPSNG